MIDKLKARLEQRLKVPVKCWVQERHIDCLYDLVFCTVDGTCYYVDHQPTNSDRWAAFEDFVVSRYVDRKNNPWVYCPKG